MKRLWKYGWLAAMTALLTTGCGGRTAPQQETKANKADNLISMDGIRQLKTEDLTVTWLRDNADQHYMRPSLFAGADSLMTPEMRANGVPAAVSTYLVERDGITVLFDTGNGAPAGCLTARLDSLGMTPADIRYIYLTHLHGDHIGGMMQGDSVLFPNAEVYLSQKEYAACVSSSAQKNVKAEAMLKAYEKQLHLFEFGDTLPGRIVAIDAIGHTPGHTVFQTGKLLIVGDLVHGAALQLPHPEICADYDMDKAKAVETRLRLLQYASENKLILAGMHLVLTPPATIDENVGYTIFPND